MPLKDDASEDSKQYNVNELIKEGYTPRQATTIAYSIQQKAKKKGDKDKHSIKKNTEAKNQALEDIYNW